MSTGSTIEWIIGGDLSLGVYRPQLGWSETPPSNAIMLSGSFRPLHRAHRALLDLGSRVYAKDSTPCFEISVKNVEKPDIAVADLEARIAQFSEPNDIVVVTRAATFLEKARLMPGTAFVVGYDTAIRLFDDRFYEDSKRTSSSTAAMGEIKALGSSFVVGGRHDADGNFKTVRDVDVPAGFESLLVEIPESVFSDPISSTQIRHRATIAEP